jgi:hypothetical protein
MKQILFLFLFTNILLYAKEIQQNGKFTFVLINDGFASKFDKNYSNGLKLLYTPKESPFSYFIGQDIYTPKWRATPIPIEDEHPYAAWLYGGFDYAFSLNETIINHLGLSIGTVGPRAQGEEVQKLIHKWLDRRVSQGWESQIFDEYGMIISLKSEWYPKLLSYEGNMISYKTSLFFDAKIGNIITYAGGGISFIIGCNLVDINIKNPDRTSYYLFGSIEQKDVSKNIFIEGNSKNGIYSYGVEKINNIKVYEYGIHIDYGLYGVRFTITQPTREFVAQKTVDRYGSLKISKRF